MGWGYAKRKNKRGAVLHRHDGYVFRSGLELRRYKFLKRRQEAGEISGLEPHPRFPFVIDGEPLRIKSKGYPRGRAASYTADFRYVETETGATVIEDTKGQDDSESRLRRALAERLHNIEVRIVKRGDE